MSSFVSDGKNSWAADDGHHDDLVMTLVLFCWLINQKFFKELTDMDVRKKMIQENESKIYENLVPFGVIDNGMLSNEELDAMFGEESIFGPNTYKQSEVNFMDRLD